MILNDDEQQSLSYYLSKDLILSELDKEKIEKHFRSIKDHIKQELDLIKVKVNEKELDKEIINIINYEYNGKKI